MSADLRCPVCGEAYAIGADGPYHLSCKHDGDHEVCDPDDAHLPGATA